MKCEGWFTPKTMHDNRIYWYPNIVNCDHGKWGSRPKNKCSGILHDNGVKPRETISHEGPFFDWRLQNASHNSFRTIMQLWDLKHHISLPIFHCTNFKKAIEKNAPRKQKQTWSTLTMQDSKCTCHPWRMPWSLCSVNATWTRA